MQFLKNLLRVLSFVWNSYTFNVLTFKSGAYFLLLTGIVIPAGQHRWMLKDAFDDEEWAQLWFLFPLVWACSAVGVFYFEQRWIAISVMLLITLDAIQIPFLKVKNGL